MARMSWGAAVAALALALAAAGCGAASTPVAVPGQTQAAQGGIESSTSLEAAGGESAQTSYLLFNQKLVEGLSGDYVDLNDVDAVFWHVFSRLPDEVTVYPTENYYYFIMYTGQRQIWGNIRLAAGRRERGVLSFAYFEFRETPFVTDPRVSASKFFTDADGLRITEVDPFTYRVSYNGKEVTFNLNRISQEPPKLFRLADNEESIMRIFDESGYRFFLIFNTERDFFLWVLNEEETVSDLLVPLREDLLVGRKSGFAFWLDRAHDDRKILIAIRGASATRNDYYDGPFDQLADNYVEQTRISEYMIRAAPSLQGRIDKYGYFTDRDRPSRVSISPYYVYFTEEALDIYFDRLKAYEDPYYFVSRKGLPPTPAPSPSEETGEP